MFENRKNILDVCDYIDHVICSDKDLFCIRIRAIKKELKRSLKLNPNCCSQEEIDFLIKRL